MFLYCAMCGWVCFDARKTGVATSCVTMCCVWKELAKQKYRYRLHVSVCCFWEETGLATSHASQSSCVWAEIHSVYICLQCNWKCSLTSQTLNSTVPITFMQQATGLQDWELLPVWHKFMRMYGMLYSGVQQDTTKWNNIPQLTRSNRWLLHFGGRGFTDSNRRRSRMAVKSCVLMVLTVLTWQCTRKDF